MIQVLMIVLTALASLISFPVGQGGFRITMGIVVFITATHVFKPNKPILLAVIAGIAVCLARIAFDATQGAMDLSLASNYLLEAFFYIGYALIYHWAVTTNDSEYPLPLVVALAISDAGANAFEYVLRHLANFEVYQNTSLLSILIAAFIRSVLIVFFIWLLEDRFHVKPLPRKDV